MTQSEKHPSIVPTLADLPPELKVMMGIYLMHWKIEEVLDRINVTPPLAKNERHLMVTLAKPHRMGDLAAEMQVQPSAITAIADGMEAKGLVTRERDPDDRRAMRLSLTPMGHELRLDLMTRAATVFHEIADLDTDETETLARIMAKLADNIAINGLPEGAKTWTLPN